MGVSEAVFSFLSPNQQHQSTEGRDMRENKYQTTRSKEMNNAKSATRQIRYDMQHLVRAQRPR